MGQEHHPLPGVWWRAIGGRRRWQCAQCPVLGKAYRGRCDTQGGHDVWDGYSDHDPQQADLAVRAGQRGAQRTEPGALTGVDWSLAVLGGVWGSGRWEDRRWRHRYPHKGSATAGTGHRTPPSNPRFGFRLPAAGFGGAGTHRSLCWPAHECPPRWAERSEPAGDIGAARDLRRSRRSWKMHEFPGGPVLGVGHRAGRRRGLGRVQRIVAGDVDPGKPFDRFRCAQAGRGSLTRTQASRCEEFHDTTVCTVTGTIDTGQPRQGRHAHRWNSATPPSTASLLAFVGKGGEGRGSVLMGRTSLRSSSGPVLERGPETPPPSHGFLTESARQDGFDGPDLDVRRSLNS